MSKQLIVVFGPPAVGKMTVGLEIQKLTGLRLFHNHMTIEPVIALFEFGSLPFGRLVSSFRRQIIEEVSASDLPGMVFTYVWDLDSDSDLAFVEWMTSAFTDHDAEVAFVELNADLDERLIRNRSPDRLEAKPSKRDMDVSERNLLSLEKHRLNSEGSIPLEHPHLIIDNTHVSAAEVAAQVVRDLGLRVP